MFAMVGLAMATTCSLALLTACDDDDDDDSSASGSSSSSETTPTESSVSGTSGDYEYVDLGLSSGNLWATCNIGADVPDDYGNYFAWGEVTTKTSYTSDSCSTYGVQLSSIQGREKYDAATALWAENWVMPKLADWVELANECSWKGAVYGDDGVVNGVFVTGSNGNSIFLPFAGYLSGESVANDKSSVAYYWTATPISSSSNTAYYFMSNAGYETDTTMSRYYGLPIRPMIKGSSDNTETQISSSRYENNYEAVDLGLSVKWATFNVGSNSPERYGDYFAWGETETKVNYSSSNSVTYGDEDMEDISGDATYDAATANWGSTWRMPTNDEFEELIDSCTWKWSSYEATSVKGYTVTGSNGNSIFLPAAGYRYGSSLYYAGSDGYYWSSTPNASYSYYAYGLDFDSSDRGAHNISRYDGRSVRPVSE